MTAQERGCDIKLTNPFTPYVGVMSTKTCNSASLADDPPQVAGRWLASQVADVVITRASEGSTSKERWQAHLQNRCGTRHVIVDGATFAETLQKLARDVHRIDWDPSHP